jgi:hypothetical protein
MQPFGDHKVLFVSLTVRIGFPVRATHVKLKIRKP